MSWLLLILFVIQFLVGFYFLLPFLLYIRASWKKKPVPSALKEGPEVDYAIIVTAYEQVLFIPGVVNAILKLNYSNYLVYIVADNCDVSGLVFNDPKVMVLRPETILANNIKSHFYAIDNFKRAHQRLTIIDSDNLVHAEYLNELNVFFEKGFQSVQGVRKAKNLDSPYACLDEAGDIYYRYVDRKLLFNAGSSATLAGSGMAFNVALYRECMEKMESTGAGFDKLLQYEIIKRGYRTAFSELAIVFDEKTAKTDQLVKQRARWLNSWFKYVLLGLKLGCAGLIKLNWNQILFSIVLLRPPLFILFLFFGACVLFNVLIQSSITFIWIGLFVIFVSVFYSALNYFGADPGIYRSLLGYPKLFYYQILALLKARKANQLSVATKHDGSHIPQ